MAEQIPYSVAASLIDKLASAAFRELGRVYGVMDELESLKSTVESIKAVLLDAEEKQEQDDFVKLWITRLKDVLYPAEDVLDEFAIYDMTHKVNSGSKNKVKEVFHSLCHSLSPKQFAFRREMAREIEKIQKKFNAVVQEMGRLNLNPRTVVVEQTDSVRRETASFVLESDIIGREDSKREIINLLSQPNKSQNISVVAIVGIGGLGKTALAQLVYNDVKVKKLFEKQIWICVSDNFDVKTIVRNMLESLAKSKIDEKLSLDNLQNQLRQALNGKKYLLVLDDTWNESLEKWTQFKTYLMCGAQNSKVLVTTRNKIVAQTMGVEVTHDLNGLNPNESWSLLRKITFRDDVMGASQTLESIGEKIAQKCRGVPLAIRTVGGLLQSTSEESEWMDVLQGEFWKLCQDEDSIMPVLKVSYQNLSPQMRQCFAYCSLYPKDWEIQKDELIELWMAQGYLQCSDEILMKDVGNKVVKTLLMKSFFQDVRMTKDGVIGYFKMHDLMHDLAMQVAGNDCCRLDSKGKTIVGRPMHVWLEGDAIGLLDSLNASRVRTLILRPFSTLNEKQLFFISNIKHLRSLSISNHGLRKLPHSIEKLKHLRYLSFSWMPLESEKSLPKFISSLVCLQTFQVKGSFQLEFFENGGSKSITVRDRGWFSTTVINSYLGFPLTNIVELSFIRCAFAGVRMWIPPLEHLPFLKSLNIDSLDGLDCISFEEGLSVSGGTFFPSLERLCLKNCEQLAGWCKWEGDKYSPYLSLPSFPRLSHLSIVFCQYLFYMPTFPNLDNSLTLIACPWETLLEATLSMAASPVHFTPLSNLKSLNIDDWSRFLPGRRMSDFQMNWVKNLTSLQHLEFTHVSRETLEDMEIFFKDDLHCFPSLKKITISKSSRIGALPEWICTLSSLQHIKLDSCPNLASLPEAMSHLTNLQTLEIIDCRRLFEECENEASAIRHNIAHIPNIILQKMA